jgi:DNA/RNA-binding domain of Phe-tRNA-synthetase-like protein
LDQVLDERYTALAIDNGLDTRFTRQVSPSDALLNRVEREQLPDCNLVNTTEPV